MNRPVLVGCLLACFTVIAYASSLSFGLIYEDHHVLPMGWQGLGFLNTTRGVQRFTFWLTGTSWPAAHALNLGLHLACGLLVWQIAARQMSATASLWAPALFWLSPLQVESVAYLQSRGDLLIAFGALLALSQVTRRTVGWRAWGLVACGIALAVGSKELGVIAALAVAWTLSCRLRHRLGWAVWLAGGVVVAWGVWALTLHTSELTMRAVLSGVSPLRYAAWQAAAFWSLLGGVIWPSHLAIFVDVETWSSVALILSLSAVAVAAGLAWRRRGTVAGWAVGLALLSVLPRFLLRQEDVLHAHHLYLAMAGVAIALASLVAAWDARHGGTHGDTAQG